MSLVRHYQNSLDSSHSSSQWIAYCAVVKTLLFILWHYSGTDIPLCQLAIARVCISSGSALLCDLLNFSNICFTEETQNSAGTTEETIYQHTACSNMPLYHKCSRQYCLLCGYQVLIWTFPSSSSWLSLASYRVRLTLSQASVQQNCFV